MAVTKLTNFLGTAPKISPELLPPNAAQIASSCKLYSGDLIAYPRPVVIGNTGRTGLTKKLFAMRDPVTGVKKWLSWLTDVDIAVASKTDTGEQRFYYSGDGVPKVSSYALATSGAGPYPTVAYDLGLALPNTVLTTVAAAFTTKTTVSYARDTANIVTLITSTPHGLKPGGSITVSEFTALSGTYAQAGTTRTGTYDQKSGTTSLLVTVTAHGLSPGAVVNLQFSADATLNGAYSVAVVDMNVVAINAPTATARSGNITWTNSGTTTITCTITAHGLSTGGQVTLDFTSGTGVDGVYTVVNVAANTFDIVTTLAGTTSGSVSLDLKNLNVTGAECTIVNDTTLTYFSPGPAFATTASTAGKINLGSNSQARSYVYTWYTPWEEESIASEPSAEMFIKEGVVVTVSAIPTAKPAGSNFVRGIRLYRTLGSTSGTEYFRLGTLWFPTTLASVRRISNVSRVTLVYPHKLDEDERFKISGCSVASFDITGGVVTAVIDAYTFEYAQVAADVASTAVAAGTLYHDISENPPTTPARYWGDASYDFVDDFEARDLRDILNTDEYEQPPEGLKGLTAIQNNIMCGFVGNTLYFSEPGFPHAWPSDYAVTLEYDIVGIAAIGGSALVTTVAYPYAVSGSDPINGMSTSQIDAMFPCLNKNSMVSMGYGVVYSTHDGLAVYSPGAASAIITKMLYNNDTWISALNPATIAAVYYGDNYFASHSTGAFVFEQDAKVGGFFTNATYSFTAPWYDSISGIVYYVSGTAGDIYEWDSLSQPNALMEWKSKVMVAKDMMNLGAARVIADYTAAVTSVWDATFTTWELTTINWSAAEELTFRLWVNKQLEFTTVVTDADVFRMPSGYRSDTFEVGITGNVRVRAIHLAETPSGLKEA